MLRTCKLRFNQVKTQLHLTRLLSSGKEKHAASSAATSTEAVGGEQSRSWREIPGPSSLPLVGQLLHFLPGGSLHGHLGPELYALLHERYGPIVRIETVFRPVQLMLFDAESATQILHSENWIPRRSGFECFDYYRKYYNRGPEDAQKSSGLVNENGESWRQFRSMVSPVMLKPQIIRQYNDVVEQVADDLVKRLRESRDVAGRLTCDLSALFGEWALESIAVVALGRRLYCMAPPNVSQAPGHAERTAQFVVYVREMFAMIEKLDFSVSLWKYFATPNFKKTMKIFEGLESFTKDFINLTREELRNREPTVKPDGELSVLEKLLAIDEDTAYIMATDMLMAGVDTTSNAALAALYLLASHPEEQARLREDVRAGRREYLRACLKESARLLPVVGLNHRFTTRSYDLHGYHIPEGMGLLFCHEIMSRKAQYFPEPNAFRPERWLASRTSPDAETIVKLLAYSPFGFGARSCIGQRIAEMELEALVSRAVQSFEIRWNGPPLVRRTRLINYYTKPFYFVLTDL